MRVFILDDVFEDETVETAIEDALHIVFLDSTGFRLGEDSSMVLKTYIYDPGTRRGTLLARLSSGVFRIVSGDMHRAGFRIVTPTATIGIRGTYFPVSVATDGSTTVSVNEGKVEVSPISAGKGVGGSVVSAKGQSVAVSAKAGRVTLGKVKQLQDPAHKNRPKKPALKNRHRKPRKNFGLDDDANEQHAVKHAGTTTDNDQGRARATARATVMAVVRAAAIRAAAKATARAAVMAAIRAERAAATAARVAVKAARATSPRLN